MSNKRKTLLELYQLTLKRFKTKYARIRGKLVYVPFCVFCRDACIDDSHYFSCKKCRINHLICGSTGNSFYNNTFLGNKLTNKQSILAILALVRKEISKLKKKAAAEKAHLKKLYKLSLQKWSNLKNTYKFLDWVGPCSFCDDAENCENCKINHRICGNDARTGIIKKLKGISNLSQIQSIIDEMIKALQEESLYEYFCKCGRVAILNVQQTYVRYSIDEDGKFGKPDMYGIIENEFYCEKCALKEGII